MISAFLGKHRNKLEISLLFFLATVYIVFLLTSQEFFFFYLPVSFIYYFLVAYIFIFAYAYFTIKNRQKYAVIRTFLIFCIIIYIFGVSIIGQILIREKTGNDFYVHDSVVLTEAATDFLLHGKNFYTENYFNTPYVIYRDIFDSSHINPALYHYAYLPLMPVFSLPFSLLFRSIFGFFDQRMVHILFFIGLVFILYHLPKNKENRILLLILFFFNPFMIAFFVSGYNDIFVLFWLILSLFLLERKKYAWSSAMLALACASKQSAWLILPFYLAYLYDQTSYLKIFKDRIIVVLKRFSPFIVISIIIFAPFIIWNAGDFIDDIYLNLAGTSGANYPMTGIGFSSLVVRLGLVGSQWDYFPFWIFQLIFGLPVLIILLKLRKHYNSLGYMVFAYGIFLFIFWYLARYFHESHLGYLLMIFTIGAFFGLNALDNKNPIKVV